MSNRTDKRKILFDYLDANPSLANEESKQQVYEALKDEISGRHFRRVWKEYVLEESMEFTPPSGNKYDTQIIEEDLHYVFRRGKDKEEIVIPQSLVKDVFIQYVRAGADMTQQEVISRNDLTPEEWNAIKGRLRLYKTSPILDPETIKRASAEEQEELMKEAIERSMQFLPSVASSRQRQQLERKYKREIINRLGAYAVADHIIEGIDSELLRTSETIYDFKYSEEYDPKYEHLVVGIADLHMGARVDGLPGTPEFNSQILKERLDFVAQRVNAYKAKSVTLLIAGDLIHSFTGTMHESAFLEMEEGFFFSKAIFESYDVLMDFCTKLINLEQVIAVSGNHDRVSKSYKMDVFGSAAIIIYEMMKRQMPEEVKMAYGDVIVSAKCGEKGFMLTHGHLKMSKSPRDVVKNHGDALKAAGAKKIYCVMGHEHHAELKQINMETTNIKIGSIFSGDRYSTVNNWFAEPGALLIPIEKNNISSIRMLEIPYKMCDYDYGLI